jgi:hypothetical protein
MEVDIEMGALDIKYSAIQTEASVVETLHTELSETKSEKSIS